jgi:N-acetylmuramoyl-L-alanine amidase
MKRYKPQMILFLIIVIEAVIMIGLVQYRSYVVKKQEEATATTEGTTTGAAVEATTAAEEGITTLAAADIAKRPSSAKDNAYAEDGVRIVCLDPALGGYAKGNISETDSAMTESEYNLEFAGLIKQALNDQNVVVYMTRESNEAVDETDRTDLANNVYADLLITLTRDSYDGDDDSSGVTAWVHHKRPVNSAAVAEDILDGLSDAGAKIKQVDAGTADSTSEDYYTNDSCIGPSLVLGMGSVLNETDITSYEENKEAYAKAVADAIVGWMDDQGL